MLDIEVTPEVADAIAEIGRVDPRYHSPEGFLFRKALALIDCEDNWCQWQHEKDGKFCSTGAIYEAAKDGEPWVMVHTALSTFARAVGYTHIVTFNDHSTHAEVMQLWGMCGHANGWL